MADLRLPAPEDRELPLFQTSMTAGMLLFILFDGNIRIDRG
jgi:hypothetical protein